MFLLCYSRAIAIKVNRDSMRHHTVWLRVLWLLQAHQSPSPTASCNTNLVHAEVPTSTSRLPGLLFSLDCATVDHNTHRALGCTVSQMQQFPPFCGSAGKVKPTAPCPKDRAHVVGIPVWVSSAGPRAAGPPVVRANRSAYPSCARFGMFR